MSKNIISHGRKDEIKTYIDPEEFAEVFIKLFEHKLRKSYVFHVTKEPGKINFKGSVFRFVWNGWNVFNSISSGEIEFVHRDDRTFIEHTIYFTEIFTICFLFTIIPLTMGGEWPLKLLIFSLIWLTYAVSYIVAVYRFNSYIGNALIEANKTSRYKLTDVEEYAL